MKLTRRFTPWSLFMLSVNGMVGSAWLFAPLYAAKIAGPASIIAWLIGGFATILVALTFAELSCLFPVAGGTAQIPQHSHGALASFVVSWTAWLSALTMAPIEVQAMLQYASTYFSSLMTIQHGVPVLSAQGLLWATLLMGFFCIVNTVSFKGLTRFNSVLFGFKVFVIILTIFALMYTQFESKHFLGVGSALLSVTGWQAIFTAVASGGIAFAFTGFKHGVELAGEAKNIAVTLPVAIIGSVIACLVLYLGLQVAFIGALQSRDLSHGWQALHFIGDTGPFAGLAIAIGLGWLAKLLYIDAAVSPGGAGLVYVTSTARILYAMSEIGYLPRWLAYVNRHNMPVAAIFVNFCLGLFLFLPFPGWQAMVNFLVSGMVISYIFGPIGLWCMRLEYPNKKRPFTLYYSKLVCLLAFVVCNMLIYWTGWQTLWKLAIALLIGLLAFVASYKKGRISPAQLGLQSKGWLFCYFVGLIIISYMGCFGGGIGWLPFGWDFLVIAVFSVVIFFYAVQRRLKIE